MYHAILGFSKGEQHVALLTAKLCMGLNESRCVKCIVIAQHAVQLYLAVTGRWSCQGPGVVQCAVLLKKCLVTCPSRADVLLVQHLISN